MKRFFSLALLLAMAPHFALALSPNSIDDPSSAEPPMFFGFETWGRKHAITINASQVQGSGSHTNFPVLITLDHLNSDVVDGGANSALNGGGDIRFSSDAAGNSQLAIEVVEFVASSNVNNRRCQIWVKVPNLSTSSNTTIYIWYNKSGETPPAASSTYGSQAVWSDYQAVWHMETNPSSNIIDATGNGYNLASTGGMGAGNVVSGAIGNAIQFDGSNDRFDIATPVPYNSSFTVTSIFNWSGNGQYNGIIANTSPWGGLWVNNGGGGRIVFYDGTGQEFSNSGNFTANSVAKFAFVATNGDHEYFFNGNPDNSGTATLTSSEFAYVGAEGNGAYFSGWLDELRVTTQSRSQGWLQTENNNQLNAAAFATSGASEDVDNGTGGGNTGGGTGGYWTQTGNDIHYNTGNVGIGTTTPGSWKLAVNGNIRAKEIKVETGWADYVFKEGYDLPTLEEVEKHIQEKGHLMNIPSEAEVLQNGIQLGEMNKLLLEKIEELTLYIIEQEKRIEALENNSNK